MAERMQPGQPTSHGNRRLAFFRGFLRQPGAVGSVVPSSIFLARRVADALCGAHCVVELGPGTGPVTQVLLRTLAAPGRLLAIELDAGFAALLSEQAAADPRLIVHCGSATDLTRALARHGLQHVDGVVSGIPFSTIGDDTGRDVLRQVWAALRPGGRFIAYQFRGDVARLARELMGPPRIGFELRNVPPIRIYTWQKTAAGEGGSLPKETA